MLDDEMRQFFEENNPYALDEIGRRLLEAAEQGLWDADPEVVDGLKDAYPGMEGWIDRCGNGRRGRRVEGKDGRGSGVKRGCDVGALNRLDACDEQNFTEHKVYITEGVG